MLYFILVLIIIWLIFRKKEAPASPVVPDRKQEEQAQIEWARLCQQRMDSRPIVIEEKVHIHLHKHEQLNVKELHIHK